jgi:hypothetical protein
MTFFFFSSIHRTMNGLSYLNVDITNQIDFHDEEHEGTY